MKTWTMHHGEALAWLRSLPDASADALITDPPYSSGGAFRGDRTASTGAKYGGDGDDDFAGDSRDQRSFLTWCTLWLSEAMRVLRQGAPVALFTDWRQLPTMTDALQCGGFVWRGVLPWVKPAARPQVGRFTHSCEFVAWGSVGVIPPREDVGCVPGHMVHHQRAADKHHQTGKPVDVMRWLVRVCPPGGLVLDPFAGSGTTGVAALMEGRAFAGCEMATGYHAIASKRLAAAALGVVVERDDTREDAPQPTLFGGAG